MYKMSRFASRRSAVHSLKGIVSCTQPLASQAGIDVLRRGGNAADAAVAVAAALNVTEPGNTGIGGDMFCLFYDSKTKKIRSLNGSGRSPLRASLAEIREELSIPDGVNNKKIPVLNVHAATVPGAAAGWADTVVKFGSGKLSLTEILTPAIVLAEEGFPVSEISSTIWKNNEKDILEASPNGFEMLKAVNGAYRAPAAGEIIRMPTLGQTFRTLGAEGKEGFYRGRIADAIIKSVSARGSFLTHEDLENHLKIGSEETTPISIKLDSFGINKERGGLQIWEHPPNGQGIVALIALGVFQNLAKSGKIPQTWSLEQHNTVEYLHPLLESFRLAFADANWWVTDPNVVKVPTEELISPSYLSERATLYSPDKSLPEDLHHGSPAFNSSDTVYFSVVDSDGNAASFINSNYSGFGTAIVPEGCGFSLQCRGAGFSLQPGHPNAYAPGKRPYHTIIPGLATHADAAGGLACVFGVMGGFMQPQGHAQTLLNQYVFGMDPQQALDAPRFCIGEGMPRKDGTMGPMAVYVEEGIAPEVVEGLRHLGHSVHVKQGWENRSMFGRGQIVRVSEDEGRKVFHAGSDPRGDGAAFPLI